MPMLPPSIRIRARSGLSRRERSFVMRGLVMHWPSVLASANPLREGQRFVRPFRKDAGGHLCGRRNGGAWPYG